MKTDEVRERFLDFFKARGHGVVKSDSLVPQNDPTLLFTGAGMNQFKDYFLGLKRDLKRAASCQKCLRAGDLDEVGRTAYHHSFFEMLGNFSFGDYFKREAIHWAWDFFTKEMRISKERLRTSVHQSDQEAYEIWRNEIKVPECWISKMGDKTNFWPSNAPQDGPNGPCGPCSEIYFDLTQDSHTHKDHECSLEDDCGRFAEIWNLVFTQYDREEGGRLAPLEKKNIDTGMGLERLACVMQGKKSNFEIDIFEPIHQAIEDCLETKITEGHRRSLYAVSDHIRAIVFSMADGVIPSNEGRGYVIRKLIRRAVWHGYEIMAGKHVTNIGFLHRVAPVVISVMSRAYPELQEAEQSIVDTLHVEEENFEATLQTGRELLLRKLDELERKGQKRVPGELVFELYDTYGLPDETCRAIAAKKGFVVDQEGFEKLMETQRKRAKQSSQIPEAIFVTTEFERKLTALPPTEFLGYHALESRSEILLAEVKKEGGVIVLDKTPFYAESGGQVGDQGDLIGKTFEARVLDTRKKDPHILHYVKTLKGEAKSGEEITASVDRGRREHTMRNHTATHLLHAALRQVLGNQVRQLGSLVAPDKLRFDYSYAKPPSADQLKQIADLVNSEILKDLPVTKEEKSTEEAKGEGALAFFGEKYGDRVRVVTVEGFSKEFCGGTHCDRTGQIGSFVIVGETSIASGVRRIAALTGLGALQYLQKLRNQVQLASDKLRVAPDDLVERIDKIQGRVKKLEKEKAVPESFRINPKEYLKRSARVGSYHLIAEKFEGLSREGLRRISDELRSQAKESVWFLLGLGDERSNFLMGLSADLKNGTLDTREMVRAVASYLGGSGGGRKELSEGGGTDRSRALENWSKIVETLVNFLKKKE